MARTSASWRAASTRASSSARGADQSLELGRARPPGASSTLQGRAQHLYDDLYVARGEACENSIKDLKNALKADRLSCHRFWANQFRLLLHSAAYVLMYELRRAARGTELADVQMDTLRLRLLKIGVQVASTARRVWFHLTSSYPWQATWLLIAWRLVHGPNG
jgi:hypothetical protein